MAKLRARERIWQQQQLGLAYNPYFTTSFSFFPKFKKNLRKQPVMTWSYEVSFVGRHREITRYSDHFLHELGS